MENFYQESGRAGRDGKEARCIMLFRLGDMFKQSTMVFTEQTGLQKLYSMVAYCLDRSTCRREMIAQHFLDTWETIPCNGMCDNCTRADPSATGDVVDAAKAAVSILEQAARREQRVTGLKLVEAVQGKGASNLKLAGWAGDSLTKDQVESLVAHLTVEGHLKEDFHFTPYSTISYLVPGQRTVKGGLVIPFFTGKIGSKKNFEPTTRFPSSVSPYTLFSPPWSVIVHISPSVSLLTANPLACFKRDHQKLFTLKSELLYVLCSISHSTLLQQYQCNSFP